MPAVLAFRVIPGGWAALRKRLQAEPGLRIIDSGATSPTNINYLTSLGHSVFLTDLATEACTGAWQTGVDEDDKPIYNTEGYLKQTLDFGGQACTTSCCSGPLSTTCPNPSFPLSSGICTRR